MINDAPLFFSAAQTGGDEWEPKNYDGKFDGPMRVRTAFAKSKNLVTIRMLRAIGPSYAQDYITKFGFDAKLHPPYLTHGPRRGRNDADANGQRLRGVCQRRLPGGPVPHRQESSTGRAQSFLRKPPPLLARTPSRRSTRETRSS